MLEGAVLLCFHGVSNLYKALIWSAVNQAQATRILAFNILHVSEMLFDLFNLHSAPLILSSCAYICFLFSGAVMLL